jgi:hypothetical protein
VKPWPPAVLAVGLVIACVAGPAEAADSASSPAPLVAEMRRAFTVDGKPVPPEVFRDFGDGDLADSGSIWVTVDVNAAIGSNLYFDEISRNGDWVVQRKVQARPLGDELTGYEYIGATENGLLVVLASFSGGGSGDFVTLHILDAALGRSLDSAGKVYDRLDLTNLRSVPLGDRWAGEVSIANNTVSIVTTRNGPTDDSGVRRTTIVEAVRP